MYALLCTDIAKGKKDQRDKGNKRSFPQGKTSQPDSGVYDVFMCFNNSWQPTTKITVQVDNNSALLVKAPYALRRSERGVVVGLSCLPG